MSSSEISTATYTKFLTLILQQDIAGLKMLKLTKECEGGAATESNSLYDLDYEGKTALHLAACNGTPEICEFLIFELGFKIDVKDTAGRTPLHYAALDCNIENAVFLVNVGADVSATADLGVTPLHLAAQSEPTDVMKILISKGVNVNAMSVFGTPLYDAALKRNKEAVELLLEHHANPNIVSAVGYSPLLAATLEKSFECVMLLLVAGARVNDVFYGTTALSVAVALRFNSIVEPLLAYDADANATDILNLTPLEHAANRGNLDVVSFLFHKTLPIKTIPEWSLRGVWDHCRSGEFNDKLILGKEKAISLYKKRADDAFKAGKYVESQYWYSRVTFEDPKDARSFLKCSECWINLGLGKEAMYSALECIRLKRDWPEAHYNEAVGWRLLGFFRVAISCYQEALRLAEGPYRKEVETTLEEYEKSVAKFSDFLGPIFLM